MVISLHATGLGAHSHHSPSLCAQPIRRVDATARACGSLGSSPDTKLHDFPPAAVVGFALRKAVQANDCHRVPESRRESGPSRPSPGAFTPHDRLRGRYHEMRWNVFLVAARVITYPSLSILNARFLYTILEWGNTPFFQPNCVKRISFDGFFLTTLTGISLCAG